MNRSAEPLNNGQKRIYTFYAGKLELESEAKTKDGPACAGGECKFKLNKLPYTFGTIPIKAFGDVINHGAHGLIGTLVIEPEGAVYLDPVTEKEIPEEDQWKLGSEALIKYEDEQRKKKTFREFVLAYQDGLNWHWPSPWSRKTEPVGDCPIVMIHMIMARRGSTIVQHLSGQGYGKEWTVTVAVSSTILVQGQI